MTEWRRAGLAAGLVALLGIPLAGCGGVVTSSSASAAPTPTPSSSGATSPSAVVSASVAQTPTPQPSLSLALPPHRDVRRVRFSVQPAVSSGGNGKITVTVTNLSSQRIDEIVLRWPTALDATLYLAPFRPSTSRLTDALVQPWTKWVIGPGEMGEPAGTTSLGWGPVDAGGSVTIPVVVTRTGAGPVAFDLQLLAGNALLTDAQGGPAITRVSVP